MDSRADPGKVPERVDSRASAATRGTVRAAAPATLLALALGVLYLVAGRMGADLSAQIEHADFARRHPFATIDFGWYGGTLPFGYSLWTPPVMAELGVRVTGVVATVAAVALFAVLLRRVGAQRQALATCAAAVTFSSSLAEGRITFACGLAAGLGALVLVAGPPRRARCLAATASAVIAGAASPVVALYLLLAAAVSASRRRTAAAAALAAAVLPLLVTSVVFGDAGRQLFSVNDALRALLATILVGVLVAPRFQLLRTGIALAVAMVGLAWLLPTPLGSNATRLSLLFAVPVVAAFGRFDRLRLGACLFVVVIVQPPVVFGTLSGAGDPVTTASYFAPLQRQLAALGPPTGRLEVPELTGHWDAAYLTRSAPLSRGWLRQLDTQLNDDVFYRSLPTAQTYRQFLDRTGTQYVAVADARPTFYGRRELKLIDGGLPYLHPVWHSAHWTLFAVQRPVPVVAAPATLPTLRADGIEFTAPAHADVVVRIRWLRWLTIRGPAGSCLRPEGDAVVLHTAQAGRYMITSTPFGARRRC